MSAMNSQLEQDFDGFDFSSHPKIIKTEPNKGLPILEEQIDITSSLACVSEDLPQCEVCGQQFLTKKELRSHITIHLGQPRIILKRCTSIQNVKKKDTYCLTQEKKGSLKLTLKKQNHSDFAVINRDLDLNEDNDYSKEVAGDNKNEQPVDNEGEEQDDGKNTFENVIVNEDEDYQEDQYENDEENYLDDHERPSVEINEGDSGVGSDMANPLEKEDQNVDDLQGVENDEHGDGDKNSAEVDCEDPEDTDALEATCRETIENLKKLGEQSSSRSIRDDMSPRDGEKNNEDTSDLNPLIERNSVLSILSKNSALEICSTREKRIKENSHKSQSGTNISWCTVSKNLADKNGENLPRSNEDLEESENLTDENPETTGSILQKFLSDHQRNKDNSESSQVTSIETEYVSLEKLAETVSTCRVCNEKFPDLALLDEHKSKTGHYQCNIPDCSNLLFTSTMEVSIHKSQAHGAPLSPSISITPAQVARSSPQLSEGSPRMSGHSNSPHLSNHSPHTVTIDPLNSQINSHQINRTSPHNSSPNQNHSPTYNASSLQHQSIPPVNFDQLPAPVQQLAQQVQRMPLPHPQMQPSLPPGANTMIPASNYFVSPTGRPPPPMYRMPGPQGMQYAPHIAHLYSQYGAAPQYSQYPGPPPMHPQMPQQMSRGRYPSIMPRAPTRMPQAMPRQRVVKRPMQQSPVQPRADPTVKQRRMDLLLPDRNEDADCHVIAQQKRNDGVPVIQNVQGAINQQNNRNDSTIHLTDSITLSVRQPGSTPAQPQNTAANVSKKTDAKAVANVLAARGITVTPASHKNKTAEQQKQQQQQSPQQQRSPTSVATPPAPVVTALNLNSAISIIPTSSQRKQQQQQQSQPQQPDQSFAMPQNKQNKPTPPDVERPPRPPTVDLTQDTPLPAPPAPGRRTRTRMFTCQICDKNFQSSEALAQHLATHRGSNKLLHKCYLCPAQYPTAQDLAMHKQTYHKDHESMVPNGGIELAIPVIDLKSPQTLSRLSNLGIQSYIPLSQLSAQTGGYFGLPIITIDGPRNPNSCNLGALGATSILSLGPLKHLTNR